MAGSGLGAGAVTGSGLGAECGDGTKVLTGVPAGPKGLPQVEQKAASSSSGAPQKGQVFAGSGFAAAAAVAVATGFPQTPQKAAFLSSGAPQFGHRFAPGPDIMLGAADGCAGFLVNPMISRITPMIRPITPPMIQGVPGSTVPLLKKAFSWASTLLFR